MEKIKMSLEAFKKNRFLVVAVLRLGSDGVQRFNRFRRRHPRWTPDLAGAVFDGLDLSGINFRRVNLIEASLVNAKLDGANLTGALMFQVELSGASLTRARGIPRSIKEVEWKDFTL